MHDWRTWLRRLWYVIVAVVVVDMAIRILHTILHGTPSGWDWIASITVALLFVAAAAQGVSWFRRRRGAS